MRPVLSFAFLLLALSVALEFFDWSEAEKVARAEREAVQQAHTIRIYSTGWKQQPVLLGRRKALQGIYVDEILFEPSEKARSGLRMAAIFPDGRPSVIDNFELGARPSELERLQKVLAETPVDTILALGSYRTMAPHPREGQEPIDIINAALRVIGVRSDPVSERFGSFAYLCIRRPQGFVPLAEHYAPNHGVGLSFHVDADRSIYDDYDAPLYFDGRVRETLSPPLAASRGVNFEKARALAGITHPAVRLAATTGESAFARWDVAEQLAEKEITDHAGATFSTNIALMWEGHVSVRAARFVLRVNGRVAAERVLFKEEGQVMLWHAWEVLLPLGEGEQVETVEVEVFRVGDPSEARATGLVSNPSLEFGRVESARPTES